ncbi:hypothetical protein TTHERM_00597640 (macronuclear) [Tetrahymena thermophila SB210]|uniref:Uncharacterized protein n=1 Tax=Tetrahymena thermophila (strain SB210) TaxID=312017 RepID=Q232D0_TETTS|nr:hypothetical protein TTHERM_00597640 [Tetrahymena thermophila SB210]EAR91482.3 hypothetical protein TTHERM_00597640 [Tetrahymena thermophila SB210]|eukprot:XP_001011727.3 hypothetical protein TTHERM_00597640 [Tetrahymena thermophila SB210]
MITQKILKENIEKIIKNCGYFINKYLTKNNQQVQTNKLVKLSNKQLKLKIQKSLASFLQQSKEDKKQILISLKDQLQTDNVKLQTLQESNNENNCKNFLGNAKILNSIQSKSVKASISDLDEQNDLQLDYFRNQKQFKKLKSQNPNELLKQDSKQQEEESQKFMTHLLTLSPVSSNQQPIIQNLDQLTKQDDQIYDKNTQPLDSQSQNNFKIDCNNFNIQEETDIHIEEQNNLQLKSLHRQFNQKELQKYSKQSKKLNIKSQQLPQNFQEQQVQNKSLDRSFSINTINSNLEKQN